MNEYKWLDKEHTLVRKYPGTDITVDGFGWDEFQDYLAGGGQVDPWKTDEEILADTLSEKLQELRDEKNRRVDAAVGTSDSRKKDKVISRSVKLLRREMKGTATAQEETELNALEVLDDFLDALDNELETAEVWLEDPARTLEQIQGYDVMTDPGWSTL